MAPETVESGREYCDNGEEVSGELGFEGCFLLIENHDLPIGVLRDDPFDEVKTESTESVFVGNHNFLEISFESEVQNGVKSFSFEVEA